MSESAQAAEAATDGEQSDDQTDEVPTEPAEGATMVDGHEGIGTRNAAKLAFARMLVDDINENERDDSFPFDVEDVRWAEGSEYSLVGDGQFALAGDSVARTRRPIWTIQVADKVLRAAAIVASNGDELTPVNQETTPGDEFQRLYENCLESVLDQAQILSENGLNAGMREAGHHPESWLAPEPTEPDEAESAGPSEDIYVTPDGTELEADEVDMVNFDPVTGHELGDSTVLSQAELAEMSDDERSDYFGGGSEDGTEYEVPEAPDETDESEADEADETDETDESDESDEAEAEAEAETVEDAEDRLTSVDGIGAKTAEKLADAGFTSPEDVKEADTDELQEAGLNAGAIGNIKKNLGA